MATTDTSAGGGSVDKLKEKLPLRAKLGYGTIGLGMMANVMLSTWQLFFYTTFAGIDVAAAGVIVSIGQIVAAFIAPVWGYLSDRMYATALGRKVGRRRMTLLVTIPGIFVFYIVQFIPGLPLWGYAAANLLYWAFNGGFQTVQYTLPAEMTDNATAKAQLVGINQIAVAIGTITLSALNTYLFSVWGDTQWDVYFRMALMYGIFTTIVLVIGFFTIQERPYDATTDFSDADASEGEQVPLLKRIPLLVWNYVSAFRIREFRYYLGMYLSQVMFRSVRGSTLTYFLVFVLGLQASEVSVSQGLSFLFGIALVGFFMWVNSKVGSSKAYRFGAGWAIVVFLLMFALAQSHRQLGRATTVIAWIILTLLLNVGITGVVNATDYAYSFIPDVDEIVTGRRREGQYASINSTIDDIFRSVESIVITSVLAAAGFVEGATEQPGSVITVLTYIFCFVPIAFCLLGIIFSRRVKLNDQNREVLAAEIDRLHNGGSMDDVSPETRKVVEELSGMPYEQCWGHNNIINYSHTGE